jgi:hypothetical protein
MRYLKSGSDEFIENGRSVVRVGRVMVMADPVRKARTVRVFEVLQVIRELPQNPAPPIGALVTLSFPDTHANCDEYTWERNDPAQLPFEVRDHKANLDAASRRN